ncbi:MAG: Spy/CpxP family protein refolding chaperone [Candidatus Obscuribacterales bacterium]
MHSSSDKAALLKRLALSLLIGSSVALNVNALAQPGADKLKWRSAQHPYLLAQGDASLPPPDPSYHPKSRFDAAGQSPAAPGGAASGIGAGAGDGVDGALIRRRMRRRAQAQGGFGEGAPGFNGLRGQVGAGVGPGSGQGPGLGGGAVGMGGGGGNFFGKKALDLTSLNLSPEQKQKIQEMRGQVAPKTRELRKQLAAKRAELRDMMFEANAGDDQVRAKRKEVRQLQDKIEDMQLNDFLGIRSVLTPDQRLKLSDLKPGNKFAAGNGAQLVAPVVSTP